MLHQTFNPVLWKSRFPLSGPTEPQVITGPRSLVLIDQARDVLNEEQFIRQACDVFVFGLGEPEDRRITKVGGLPFRAKSAVWPIDSQGEPLAFLAQFCFADSQDLVPSLPGGVLLIFGGSWDEPLHFEWQLLDLAEPLVEQLPEMVWAPRACYGVIYRSWDAPLLDIHSKGYPRLLTVLEGTKIGGAPFLPPDTPQGKFLCSLGSISPPWDEPWPWINVEAPEEGSENDLKWGDLDSLRLYWDGERVIPFPPV